MTTRRILNKAKKLNPGDRVATVSLSWGGAGDEAIRARYFKGKKRLEEHFNLEVVEMPHTLAGSRYLYEHPEARASDWMDAFLDPQIKGIFSTIGGDDTIRLLPHIDFDVIRNNPKIFVGYSDSTVNHLMCYKAGLSSFYGPAVLSDFAENVSMPDYTIDCVKKTLFCDRIIGDLPPAPTWSAERLEWLEENENIQRSFQPNTGYECLQGEGRATGPLIGGCLEVFDWLRGTMLFPDLEDFDGAILFFETSEDCPDPELLRFMLRPLGAMGVLERINGMIWGKPYGERFYEAYKAVIASVLSEYGRHEMPVLYNLSFGHCEPKFTLPYGAVAAIDCDFKGFSILESAVIG